MKLFKITHKILCFFGIHSYNISFLTAVVHLECKHCTAERVSMKAEMYEMAYKQKKIFETEKLLTRKVMIEKIPSFILKLRPLVEKRLKYYKSLEK